MSLISNVYSFKFFIEPLGCLCSKEEVGRMPRRCAATVPLQDEDHPENDPHLVPGFPGLCSGMFPERFRRMSAFVGSKEIRLI